MFTVTFELLNFGFFAAPACAAGTAAAPNNIDTRSTELTAFVSCFLIITLHSFYFQLHVTRLLFFNLYIFFLL